MSYAGSMMSSMMGLALTVTLACSDREGYEEVDHDPCAPILF